MTELSKEVESPIIFIENGQIKIADESGKEYVTVIENQRNRLVQKDELFTVYTCLGIISFLCGVSTLFVNFFDKPQVVFFALMAFLFLFVSLFNRINRAELNDVVNSNVAEFNRAKKILQSEIMDMEKELAEHKSLLQNIGNQKKFNFKIDQEVGS